jgi:hypothetical protein
MNEKTTLIIGSHPILENVIEQYTINNYTLFYFSDKCCINDFDEIFIATNTTKGNEESEDLKNIKFIVDNYNTNIDNKKTNIHILLHSPSTLTMFQRKELCANLKQVEIYPFTLNSLWAQTIFVNLPNDKLLYPNIDRENINVDSNKFVHVILFSMNSMSETLAEYIALTSHYANYTRNHSLRTRITIIDDEILSKKNAFINKNRALFDNSYYRIVNLDNKSLELHKPLYHDKREDFVDIEWEFVKTDTNNQILRDKLSMWAKSDKQMLSVFLCSDTEENNLKNLMSLPKELEDNDVPIFTRIHSTNTAGIFNMGDNIHYFGMNTCRYDIKQPLVRLAKMVNYIYDSCYNDNYANGDKSDNIYSPISIDIEEAEKSWNKLSSAKKWSNIYNAMNIPSKMRALGYSLNNWGTYNGMSYKEISIIAEIEHNRWNVEELLLGYYPVNDEQEKEIENDISKKKYYKERHFHYDLRAYNDLRPDDSGKNVSTYDICLSKSTTLLANYFLTTTSDE